MPENKKIIIINIFIKKTNNGFNIFKCVSVIKSAAVRGVLKREEGPWV